MEIRRLGPGDDAAVAAAGHLFDSAPRSEPTRRLLHERTHFLLVAYDADAPVGFVSGVEITHPDKGTEMFLYELGVEEASRGRGIGRALTEALAALARDRGCYGMWVGTEPSNTAALAVYRAAGATSSDEFVALTWAFD